MYKNTKRERERERKRKTRDWEEALEMCCLLGEDYLGRYGGIEAIAAVSSFNDCQLRYMLFFFN